MAPKASELLERMRASKYGWKRNDLDKVYTGFGFVLVNGRSHDIFKHPKYPQLGRAVVPRHKKVNAAYIQHAIELIDRLMELENEQ